MDIHTIYPGKKGTSKPNKAYRIYPYLLRDIEINCSNHVWCTDITYLPMAKGFAYLVAIMDWHSRKVLSWRLSNVMDTDFCIDALNKAIERLWRSVKYEKVYLYSYESLTEAWTGLEKYFVLYNSKRKHQTLNAKPDEVYYTDLPQIKMAV